MLNRMMGILENLVVFEDRMKSNIYLTNGVIFAQRVMNALIEKGFVREQAYDTVQPVAMQAMATGAAYQDLLKTERSGDGCTYRGGTRRMLHSRILYEER